MIPLHVGWGWHPTQTDHIHIRHVQCVWGIGMLSQGHIGAPLYLFTAQADPRFWSFGSLVEWKWCNYIIVEAHIHFRLLSTSILDIDKVFELLLCCLTGIWVHPYTVTQANLAPDFGFFVTCGVEMMPLHHGWGWYLPQTASHIHNRHVQSVWGIGMLSHRHMGAPLYHYRGWLAQVFEILGSLVEWKWCHFIIIEAHIHLRLLPTSILDI